MKNPYQAIVQLYDLLLQNKDLPLFSATQTLPKRIIPSPTKNALHIVLFSPHPDDECITGILPLRLMQESEFAVTSIAVTLGSNPARKAARLQELERACAYLGFELCVLANGAGLHNVTLDTRTTDKGLWLSHVSMVAEHIHALQPQIIMLPHAEDVHPVHCGTHTLIMDALKFTQHACWLVQSEFWQPMRKPNLMLACSNNDMANLMIALACHVGEVSRNPYHLRLPVWMADNVRRGAEIIAGKGQSIPGYSFATLYRVNDWNGERLLTRSDNYFVAAEHSPAFIFQR